jgi:hypothetical protein
MSAEYRPASTIPFFLIDKRLEKYGMKVELRGSVTALIGPRGTLFARPEGNSTHFERHLGVDTEAVLSAIHAEYGIQIVDENDYRFWGFESWEAAFLDRLSDRWIVVEGPSPDDVDFTIRWLLAARQMDHAWHSHAWDNPEVEGLYSYNPTNEPADQRRNADFGAAALAFVGKWLENGTAFVLNIYDSRWREKFWLMMVAGFFVLTGDRYQMMIPSDIAIKEIHGRLSEWLKRTDREGLSSIDLFLTQTEGDARSWEARLRHMDIAARIADRAILIAN